jgi:hypothetical protein
MRPYLLPILNYFFVSTYLHRYYAGLNLFSLLTFSNLSMNSLSALIILFLLIFRNNVIILLFCQYLVLETNDLPLLEVYHIYLWRITDSNR